MNAEPHASSAAPDKGGAFPTTRWSMVLRAGSGSESQVRAALETLCRQYWYPLYAFARRQGRAHHEAEDCTQEFLVRLLATDGVAGARPERGRFRTFLLAALQNFLANEWRRASAAKRGGGTALLSLEFETAEMRFALEPADPALTPDQIFDRDWALDLADLVFAELRAEYALSGRGPLFEILGPRVWSAGNLEPSESAAERIGLTAQAFDVALHRLRRRVGERLRAHVAETVAAETEIESELRHLVAALKGIGMRS
jgi:DNA-directed RNA polymerase specialized sigma24 family protein